MKDRSHIRKSSINEGRPMFSKRLDLNKKCQVRFFTNKEIYANFTERVKAEGLLIQDVFSDFMEWFSINPIETYPKDFINESNVQPQGSQPKESK